MLKSAKWLHAEPQFCGFACRKRRGGIRMLPTGSRNVPEGWRKLPDGIRKHQTAIRKPPTGIRKLPGGIGKHPGVGVEVWVGRSGNFAGLLVHAAPETTL